MAKTTKKMEKETTNNYKYFFCAWLFKEGEDAKIVDGVYEALQEINDSITINHMKSDLQAYFEADGITLMNYHRLEA